MGWSSGWRRLQLQNKWGKHSIRRWTMGMSSNQLDIWGTRSTCLETSKTCCSRYIIMSLFVIILILIQLRSIMLFFGFLTCHLNIFHYRTTEVIFNHSKQKTCWAWRTNYGSRWKSWNSHMWNSKVKPSSIIEMVPWWERTHSICTK